MAPCFFLISKNAVEEILLPPEALRVLRKGARRSLFESRHARTRIRFIAGTLDHYVKVVGHKYIERCKAIHVIQRFEQDRLMLVHNLVVNEESIARFKLRSKRALHETSVERFVQPVRFFFYAVPYHGAKIAGLGAGSCCLLS